MRHRPLSEYGAVIETTNSGSLFCLHRPFRRRDGLSFLRAASLNRSHPEPINRQYCPQRPISAWVHVSPFATSDDVSVATKSRTHPALGVSLASAPTPQIEHRREDVTPHALLQGIAQLARGTRATG